jgi:hypothetical protein
MMPDDDSYRYIEYLQEQMLQTGWDKFFDASEGKSRATELLRQLKELPRWDETTNGRSFANYIERNQEASKFKTRYEVPISDAIFKTVLDEVALAAEKIGLNAIRPVEVVSSTDISSTLAARPTTGDHLLFAGLGTSSYCNYWSKTITAVVQAIQKSHGFEKITQIEEVEQSFRGDSSGLLLACRLSLHYAFFGTVIGFGKVEQPEEYLAYRVALLQAMETFAVAHEYSHFVAHERFPEVGGTLDPTTNHDLERFCDELGLQISREIGNASKNFLTFAGIGALVFFRTIQLCSDIRTLIIAEHEIKIRDADSAKLESSHPDTEERIAAIRLNLVLKTAADQQEYALSFFDEYDLILRALCKTVIKAFPSGQKG